MLKLLEVMYYDSGLNDLHHFVYSDFNGSEDSGLFLSLNAVNR